MPLIIRSKHARAVVQIAHASALRSADEVIEQLREQLCRERDQHRFNLTQKEEEIALLLRDLAEAKYELARRDTRDALASAPSPSAAMH